MQAQINSQIQGVAGNPKPPEGLKTNGPIVFVFANAVGIEVNLANQMQQGTVISFARSAFIDNSENPNPISFQIIAGHNISVLGHTQGWYPVAMPRPINFVITCAAGSGTTLVTLANFEMPASSWVTQ